MKRWRIAFLAFLVVTAGCLDTGGTEPVEEETEEVTCPGGHTGPGNGIVHTVNITADGFAPGQITVSQGDSVRFVNQDSARHWPASDIHPTHTKYPGSGISKCGTAERQCTFDACNGLAPGEQFTYTFNQEGDWTYHDHVNTGMTGTITVE